MPRHRQKTNGELNFNPLYALDQPSSARKKNSNALLPDIRSNKDASLAKKSFKTKTLDFKWKNFPSKHPELERQPLRDD
jgi:hypothetical protein